MLIVICVLAVVSVITALTAGRVIATAQRPQPLTRSPLVTISRRAYDQDGAA